MRNGQIDLAMSQEVKNIKKINETQRKIIHLLNDFGIDRISMAGITRTLEQENLNENTFLNFI